MEHRVLYKSTRDDREQIADELKEYANALVKIEQRFADYTGERVQQGLHEKHDIMGEISPDTF